MGLNLNTLWNGTVKLRPPIPLSFTLTVLSDTEIKLDCVTNFAWQVWRSTTENGTYTYVATVAKGTLTYTNTGLTQGTLYYYKIRSVNGSKFSAFTASSSALTEIPFIADLDMRLTGRTSYTMVDSVGDNDATILKPYLYRPDNTCVAAVTDNGALDIGVTDFTMCGWVNDRSLTNTSVYIFFGKGVQGSQPGRYMFYTIGTTRYFYCLAESSVTTVNIGSAIASNAAGWTFLYMDVNQTTKKVRFFINNTEIGTAGGTSFTGTFPALDNKFKFRLQGTNTTAGLGADVFTGDESDIRVYNRLLSDTERTNLYNKINVTGTKAHYPLTEFNMNDVSGNNYHPVIANSTSANILYGIAGSGRCLDLGYDIYKSSGLADIHIPLKDNGESITTTNLAATYYKHSTVSGNTNYHNMADSMLLFSHASWDRSDTTIYSDYSRAANTKYIAATPKLWHISELEILKIKLFANTNYKTINFPKFHGFREYLEEIYTYQTNKLTSELRDVLYFSNNYDAYHDIDYYIDDRNIVSTRNDYMLVFDVSNHTLSLSIDGGLNYLNVIDLTGIATSIKMAYIYENGDVIFGTETKMFYSDDLLDTYHESTVLDENGDAYVPPTYDAFTRVMPDNYFKINGLEMPVWGNYSTRGGTYQAEVNCWYTIDGGQTIKSFLHFTGDGTSVNVAHIHSINYISLDNSFIIQTGDGNDEETTSRWYKATYNTSTDIWTTELAASSDKYGYYKTVGMALSGTDVIFGEDSYKFGIWKSAYANLADSTQYQKICNVDINGTITETYVLNLFGDEQNIIVTIVQNTAIIISTDLGKSWYTHELTGLPDLIETALTPRIITIYPKNADGYYLIHLVEASEFFSNTWTLGKVLMLKITKP